MPRPASQLSAVPVEPDLLRTALLLTRLLRTRLPGTILLLALVLFSPAFAQKSVAVAELQPLAFGVTLPVRLGRSLQAGKVRPGTGIVVTTTQRVPVGVGFYLHHGAKLRGAVVASVKGDGASAQPSVLSLRFTSLEYRGRTVPIATRVIAIANFVQVDETAVPTMGVADRGNSSPASWTTMQVGGDVLARSGGSASSATARCSRSAPRTTTASTPCPANRPGATDRRFLVRWAYFPPPPRGFMAWRKEPPCNLRAARSPLPAQPASSCCAMETIFCSRW